MTTRYEDLIAYAAGELEPDAAARLEAELASDPGARRTVDRYRRAAATLGADDSVAPPAEALRRAKAVFDPSALARPAAAGWWQALERIIATLSFDSRQQAAAVRYADAGDRIQLAFETERVDIDVQAERLAGDSGPASWRLTGQIAGDRVSACRVVLLDDAGAAVGETTTDDRGMFTFDAAGGRYELGFAVDDGLLVAPAVELPAS